MRDLMDRRSGEGRRLGTPGAPECNGGRARPPVSLMGPLFAALDEREIPAAIVRTEDEEVLVLVRPEDREHLAEAASAAGLTRVSVDPVRGDLYHASGAAGGTAWMIRGVASLRYGTPLRCLGLGQPAARLLSRRMSIEGIPHLAPEDRLVDHTLHALLDDHGVPSGMQRCLRHLLEDVRSEPVRAGRAAEVVQRELAPAVPWRLLLAQVVLGRWQDLAGRRRKLARHLFRRRPLATLAAALRDARHAPGRAPSPRESSIEAAAGSHHPGEAGEDPETELLAG